LSRGPKETLQARCGVVLAAGGFAAGALAARYRPHTREHYTMSPPPMMAPRCVLPAHSTLAKEPTCRPTFSGRRYRCCATPTARRALPAPGHRPGQAGRDCRQPAAVRFVNESNSYHHFASAMQSQPENAPCFLICDALAMKRYGLGLARPAPVNNDALIEAGYLHKADPSPGWRSSWGWTHKRSPRRWPATTATPRREDPQFAKGGNSYNRAMGDPGHQPNACNAPLLSAPFYAITLYTGDLGTSRGLVTTADAQVVNQQRQPIQGLYAVGNDMDSMMAGTYPGPGITLGPALTFGYLSARHMAQQQPHNRRNIMIYEKRTYTINPLKMADWLALYKSDAYAVQTEHLGKLIGFFFTEIGVVNQVVHIWAYESLDDRLVRRARMAQDERWLTFSRKNRELAAVERLESVLLRPTDFSPLQ
jgi:hypothetical protein